ncbi:hypothetical protein WM46_15215 [Citrobacter freundii complex sp. CFNIH2]|uniref:transposase n=1 Tax=Citrobacter freundii complex sp. CFNIH2 TaxID=2066049 RepID=UPI000C86C6C9|nr:hypothetical protein WM46_15215 [Citrobacter freundii complex sp. CFNIH2]
MATSRGRPQGYSALALAITTVLGVKRLFRLNLRAVQGFIDSIFTVMVSLCAVRITPVSASGQRSFKTHTRGEIASLVIDSTVLKVFGEGEWKVKKHGKERRCIWRQLIWLLTRKRMKSCVLTYRFTTLRMQRSSPDSSGRHIEKSGQRTALMTPGYVTIICAVRKLAPSPSACTIRRHGRQVFGDMVNTLYP